jgi:predicted small metal-binding protein
MINKTNIVIVVAFSNRQVGCSSQRSKMKSLACKDMGMDCDFVATGNTVEEVKQKAMAHAQVVHADILKTMSSPAQMAEMQKTMDKIIKQTA